MEQRRVSVLIVGSENIGIDRLVQELLSMSANHPKISLSIQVTPSLSAISRQQYSNIQYIIFVLDMRNEQSWSTVKEAIHQTDTIYFQGRSCIAVLEVLRPSFFAFGVDQVAEMAEALDIRTLFGSTEEPAALNALCEALLNTIGLNCGKYSAITPGVLQVGRHF